ncbi:enoyl-CoA hydratase/isomerase family protein [Pseudobacteriovorax antillogorgiicola]|uniref:Enoyl-CoA hydratase n=1 Tax=Pseudobacteriovorax antillogorgiicola TaxID=1513793 RepID=A0A1Y6B869_9BACT|nr:enoyl-CoA hydratase/isomerase family protein [Pseudobacteriovorax antillogorgiicola]TCS58721.1 enoyl-CoA hydratase [Pseudobacteriovorax antillogorgiicola]SME95379.1 Enoyl-CoA hydratase [Pseudobacteriovorax antillogorgiicola]
MHVIKSSHDYYIKWRIQRPERFNALGPSLGKELLSLLEDLKNQLRLDKQVRALVVTAETVETSRGPIWIAGGDLKELAALDSKSAAFAYGEMFQNLAQGFRKLPIPVIMAVDGQAIGGGIEFTLGADIRIATSRSSLHFKQTQVGLATGYGGSTLLKELVGLSRATGWLLLNQTVSADDAQIAGLFHQVVPDHNQLESTCVEWAHHFARQSPEGLAGQKKMLYPEHEHHDSLKRELNVFAEIWRNPSHSTFLERFTNKTKA